MKIYVYRDRRHRVIACVLYANTICDRLHKRGFQEVKAILEMPEWTDEKFKEILTSNIWKSNATDVKTKLHLNYWNDKAYKDKVSEER